MKEEFIKRLNDLESIYGQRFPTPHMWEKVRDSIYEIVLDYEDFIAFAGYSFISIRHEVQDDSTFCDFYIFLNNRKTKKTTSVILRDFLEEIFTVENSRRYTIETIIA